MCLVKGVASVAMRLSFFAVFLGQPVCSVPLRFLLNQRIPGIGKNVFRFNFSFFPDIGM